MQEHTRTLANTLDFKNYIYLSRACIYMPQHTYKSQEQLAGVIPTLHLVSPGD